MSKLVLIGGGGHCKSVLDSALRMKAFDRIVITDAEIAPGTKICGCEVVGPDDCLQDLREQGFDKALITVGAVKPNPLRQQLALKVASLGYEFISVIDPTAVVSDFADIEEGTFIGKSAVINAGVHIGRHCIINSGAIVEHDCLVGEFSHVSVGSILCGGVILGNNCLIGAGSTVIQYRKIGNGCVIGAGAVVNEDVPSGLTVVGVPAKQK